MASTVEFPVSTLWRNGNRYELVLDSNQGLFRSVSVQSNLVNPSNLTTGKPFSSRESILDAADPSSALKKINAAKNGVRVRQDVPGVVHPTPHRNSSSSCLSGSFVTQLKQQLPKQRCQSPLTRGFKSELIDPKGHTRLGDALRCITVVARSPTPDRPGHRRTTDHRRTDRQVPSVCPAHRKPVLQRPMSRTQSGRSHRRFCRSCSRPARVTCLCLTVELSCRTTRTTSQAHWTWAAPTASAASACCAGARASGTWSVGARRRRRSTARRWTTARLSCSCTTTTRRTSVLFQPIIPFTSCSPVYTKRITRRTFCSVSTIDASLSLFFVSDVIVFMLLQWNSGFTVMGIQVLVTLTQQKES